MIGFSLLEVVNYLEHYGLLRHKREDGRYERCLPEHSWNSNNVASNVLLYHLQRHSDHHANPTRRYQALRHVEEAPQLPTGYAGMIVLAWFPPLWRRVMDPILLDHFEGDVTRANIQPRKREQVLARYGRAPGRPREPLALPRLRLRLRRAGGAPARGLPGGHAVERGPRRLGLPGLRRPREGRLRARRGRRVTAPAATMGAMAGARTPYPEAARELLRQTLFGAARDRLEQRAWSEITMSDIAASAGVSRQTLYKEFGNRNEFGLAFVIHEGERFLDDVEAAVKQHLDDPRAAVGAALELFLRTAGEDPLIRILLSDDGTGGMLPFVTTQGMPVVQWATARLGTVIEEGWPQAPKADVAPALRSPRAAGDQLHHQPHRVPRGDRLVGGPPARALPRHGARH